MANGINYAKLLSGGSTGGTPSTLGLSPEMIAGFSRQRQQGVADRRQLIERLAGKKQPTMIPIMFRGNKYNVPVQHAAGLSAIEQKERADKENLRRYTAQSEEQARQQKIAEDRAAVRQPLEDALIKSQTKKYLEVGKPKVSKPTISELTTQSAEARKLQQNLRARHEAIIFEGKGKNKRDFETRAELGRVENRNLQGNTFYFPKTIEKKFDPLKGQFDPRDEEVIESWDIPVGAKLGKYPITKELILDQYRMYGGDSTLEDFIMQHVKPNI